MGGKGEEGGGVEEGGRGGGEVGGEGLELSWMAIGRPCFTKSFIQRGTRRASAYSRAGLQVRRVN